MIEINKVELVVDAKAELGEGPIWDARNQVLYWVNIFAGEVHIYNPETQKDRVIEVGQSVGTVVPRQSGGLMLALHHGFASLDLETGAVMMIHDPEADLPENRFNDGKCDPAGRFWAGTMSLGEAEPVGSLYRMNTDLSVHPMLTNVTISNGLAWSHDHTTMYYIDTPTGSVDGFDYDHATGEISNRRVAISIPAGTGFPDGMTMDAEGMLWVAHWGGHRVTRWNPTTGEQLMLVSLPAPNVTACAFGGPNLDQLYITTARKGLDEEMLERHPSAGGLFQVDLSAVGMKGEEAFEFGG